MKLETENIKGVDATVELIQGLMSDGSWRAGFLIISHNDDDAKFVQITFDENTNAFALEYRDGDDKPLYCCNRPVYRAEAENALIDYIEEVQSWKSRFDWEIDNDHRVKGCSGWMLPLGRVSCFIAILCVVLLFVVYLKTGRIVINLVKVAISSLVLFYVLRFISKK